MDTKSDLWQELHAILLNMAVPPDRLNDFAWLRRNLGICNKNHTDFSRAEKLIFQLSR